MKYLEYTWKAKLKLAATENLRATRKCRLTVNIRKRIHETKNSLKTVILSRSWFDINCVTNQEKLLSKSRRDYILLFLYIILTTHRHNNMYLPVYAFIRIIKEVLELAWIHILWCHKLYSLVELLHFKKKVCWWLSFMTFIWKSN